MRRKPAPFPQSSHVSPSSPHSWCWVPGGTTWQSRSAFQSHLLVHRHSECRVGCDACDRDRAKAAAPAPSAVPTVFEVRRRKQLEQQLRRAKREKTLKAKECHRLSEEVAYRDRTIAELRAKVSLLTEHLKVAEDKVDACKWLRGSAATLSYSKAKESTKRRRRHQLRNAHKFMAPLVGFASADDLSIAMVCHILDHGTPEAREAALCAISTRSSVRERCADNLRTLTVDEALHFMDGAHIKDTAYHEMRMLLQRMHIPLHVLPPLCQVVAHKKAVNDKLREELRIAPIVGPGDTPVGVRADIERVIKFALNFIDVPAGLDRLLVKSSLDNRKVARDEVLWGIQLMNVDLAVCSAQSVLPILYMEGHENATALKEYAGALVEDWNKFCTEERVINGMRVEAYMCLDYSALWELFGFGGVSADYKCMWCTCSQKERRKPTKDIDIEAMRRSKEHLKNSVFNMDPETVIPCVLHLLLRVVNQLFFYIIEYSTKQHVVIERLRKLLAQHHIGVSIYRDKTRRRHKWAFTGLTGYNAERLLGIASEIGKCTLQCEKVAVLDAGAPYQDREVQETADTIRIWEEFRHLFSFIARGPSDCTDVPNIEGYEARARLWFDLLLERYGNESARVYPHAVAFHLVEPYRKLCAGTTGGLLNWSNEALEAAHKRDRIIYYQGTPHGGAVSKIRKYVSTMECTMLRVFRELLASKGQRMKSVDARWRPRERQRRMSSAMEIEEAGMSSAMEIEEAEVRCIESDVPVL